MNSDLKEFIDTTKDLLDRLNEKSDVTWTRFKDVGALKSEVLSELKELEKGDMAFLPKVYSHYLPTSTFQESYIDEYWEENQLDISARMDELFIRLRPIERRRTTIAKFKDWLSS